MKTKHFFTTALMIINSTFLILNCNASVFTVSNDPAGGAQYATLQTAYAASASGDTLIMEGTNIPYTLSPLDWAKKLTVIGIGFNPNKVSPRHTVITAINPKTTGNGSSFYGIEFTGTVQCATTQTLANYDFEDCLFDAVVDFDGFGSGSSASNMIFRNSIFKPANTNDVWVSQSYANTLWFYNCIFNGYIEGSGGNLSNVTVDHCLFLSNGVQSFNSLKNGVIQNSIFMNSTTIVSNCSSNTFTNNLCALAATMPPVSNSGAGNITAQDPLFTNYVANAFYNTLQDYHLQAGSLAIGTATDGTDIGVHGGTSHFSETGEVLINPIIRSLNINNSSVAPNGNLNVHINATKPTDN